METSKYTAYESSGLAKHVKTPKVLEFRPLSNYFAMYNQIFETLNSDKAAKLTMEMIESA